MCRCRIAVTFSLYLRLLNTLYRYEVNLVRVWSGWEIRNLFADSSRANLHTSLSELTMTLLLHGCLLLLLLGFDRASPPMTWPQRLMYRSWRGVGRRIIWYSSPRVYLQTPNEIYASLPYYFYYLIAIHSGHSSSPHHHFWHCSYHCCSCDYHYPPWM